MTSASLLRLDSHADVLAATGDDAFVRLDVPAPLEGPAWRLGHAVAVPRRTRTRRLGLAVLGPVADVSALGRELARGGVLEGSGVSGVTVQRDAFEAFTRHVPVSPDGGDWEWMCTTSVPPTVAHEERVEPLGRDDEDDVRALLASDNPLTDARPFESPGQRWLGVRDADGGLVACGVRLPGLSGVQGLEGITARASARGLGLGLAVTAVLTREAVVESGVCTLGMYSSNDVARRVYTGLGYGDVHAWSSRPLLQP